VALAVASLVGSGCADDGGAEGAAGTERTEPPDATSTTIRSDGLSAVVERSRLFAAHHMMELVLRSDRAAPRSLTAYRLESPLFDPIALHHRTVALRTGGVPISVPLPYGEPRCDEAPDETSQVAAVIDGREVRLPVDESPLLQQHTEECAGVLVREAVELRFGDRWTAGAPGTLEGQIELRRRRQGTTVVVDEMAGTVVFSLSFGEEPAQALRVDDDHERAEVPVVVTVSGCSAHALIESKKTYRFPTWVSVDGAEPVRVEVEPDGPARTAFEDLLAACQP
jgi:hypothetical protein